MSGPSATVAALRASLDKPRLEGRGHLPPFLLGARSVDDCLGGGLRRGVLHDIRAADGHGAAAIGFAAALAFRAAGAFSDQTDIGWAQKIRPTKIADRQVLWIRTDFSAREHGELAATGFLELGLDPARLLLVQVSDAAGVLRGGRDALACAALGAVVMEFCGSTPLLDLVASQRLAFACAEQGGTAFLLQLNGSPGAHAAETRWHVRAVPSVAGDENWGAPLFEVELARHRHGRTGRFRLQWSCDDGLFREPERTAHCGAVVRAPAHRPGAACAPGVA